MPCLFFIFGSCLGWVSCILGYKIATGDKITIGSVLSGICFCPKCNHKLVWLEQIPIFSYAILLGKCRSCRYQISFVYPLLEVFCGALYVLIYYKFHNHLFELFIISCTCFTLIVASIVDIITFSIFDVMLFLLFGLGILNTIFVVRNPMTIAYSIVMFVVLLSANKFGEWFLKRDVIGFGDVILMPILILFLHYTMIPVLLMVSGACGVLFSLLWNKSLKFKRGKEFPFVPAITIGFFCALIC